MQIDQLYEHLYKLKKASFYYGTDSMLIDYIQIALSDVVYDDIFYDLLKSFLTKSYDRTLELRLHLAFRRKNLSGRYQLNKALYDTLIDDENFAHSHIDTLESLL